MAVPPVYSRAHVDNEQVYRSCCCCHDAVGLSLILFLGAEQLHQHRIYDVVSLLGMDSVDRGAR